MQLPQPACATAHPAERILLGPGPSPVPQRVLRALAAPTIGHLDPQYIAIMDETDSGLDIDALRIVAHGVNALKRPDNATIVVTHYQRLLNYIVPDVVHVMSKGKVVKSGGKELALELEANGYAQFEAA